jgi:hypothetical protein
MPPSFSLSLKVDSPEVLRGESNFFQASLKNDGTEAASSIRPFAGDGGGLSLRLWPQSAQPQAPLDLGPTIIPGEKVAGSGSFEAREGVHVHGPEEFARVTLAQGAQWSARGDLLEWFGEVPPGSYNVAARYNSGYDIIDSPTVPVKVTPPKPLVGAAARNGSRHFAARPCAAFVHSSPDGRVILAQVNSDALPRTPFRGIRVAEVGEPAELRPATSYYADAPNAHVLYSDGKAWSIATVPLDGKPPKTRALESPMAGVVLQSPLSHSDGGLAVPFADAALGKVFLLRYAPDGGLTSAPELDLKGVAPIGPYACCWEQDAALHFVWASAKGREVWHASRSMDDPEAVGAARLVCKAPAPILWLDAWVDVREALGVRPMFVETGGEDPRHAATPIPLMLKVWCVTASPSSLTCTEYNVADTRTRVAANFKLDKEQKFRVLHSVVRPSGEIGVLLAEAGGELWYASTGAQRLAPLAEWGARGVTAAHSPSLFAASSRGTLPWVYLRHLDQAEGRIVWTKLEPAGEHEPGEHSHAH